MNFDELYSFTRETLGMTQEHFARELKISQGTLSKIEAGKSRGCVRTFLRLGGLAKQTFQTARVYRNFIFNKAR